MKKTTVYIDVDDDIAAIIDKVASAPEKIVALVLPKRAATLQSTVNIKLLKRAADTGQKSIVLVTAEESIVALAGANSLHVSPSLQTKPKIPQAPVELDQSVVEVDAAQSEPVSAVELVDSPLDPRTPIGTLAGLDDNAPESIDLNDEVGQVTAENTAIDSPVPAILEKKNKKLRVPNFTVFRSKAFLGIFGVIVLGAAMYWALIIAPTAHIVVKTEQSDVPTKLTFQAKGALTAVNLETSETPALLKDNVQKLADTFVPTGQKDVGSRASGSVKFYNCSTLDKLGDITRTVPAGTGISSGGKTFITQAAVDVEPSGYSGSNCKSDKPSAFIKVVASESGDTYNLSARDYAVAGFGTMTATDSVGMSGGVSKVVKIVSQEDVETAKAKLTAKAASDIKGKLAAELASAGYVAVPETFTAEQTDPVPAAAVGAEASGDVAVTMQISSTMLGIKAADISQLLEKSQTKTIDTAKQRIYDSGALTASLSVIERPAKDSVKISVVATGKIGPVFDAVQLKTEIAGKKAGEAKQMIESRPGIKEVSIRLTPFWVSSIPSKQQKTTLTIDDKVQ